MKIGNIELDNNIFLAPMAGTTDKAFRLITKPYGPALMYTEMISAKGLFYKNEKTRTLLSVDKREGTVCAQIFGHEPDVMGEIAYNAISYGACMVDINMGCPTPKIVNNGDGSALMKTPALAGSVIKAVADAVDVPVTVKIRKGWDDSCVNAVEMAKIAEQNGALAVTIHGRTREQFYSGVADWEIIKRVKEAVYIPVIGNGDIVDGKSAKRILSETGCDGIMIGRAAQGNPWIFREVMYYLELGKELPKPNAKEKLEKALEHTRLLVELKGEIRGIKEARKHIAWYVKGLNGSANFRGDINKIITLKDAEKLIFDCLCYDN